MNGMRFAMIFSKDNKKKTGKKDNVLILFLDSALYIHSC